jgi:hypothetical protein
MTKRCPKCNKDKKLSQFSDRGGKRSGKLTSYCKLCMKDAAHDSYRKTKREHNPHKKYRNKCKQFIKDSKNKPCADCKITYPHYVMQFDHVRGEKLFTIGASVSLYGIPSIKAEIEKCEVVCANCHSTRTWIRRNFS